MNFINVKWWWIKKFETLLFQKLPCPFLDQDVPGIRQGCLWYGSQASVCLRPFLGCLFKMQIPDLVVRAFDSKTGTGPRNMHFSMHSSLIPLWVNPGPSFKKQCNVVDQERSDPASKWVIQKVRFCFCLWAPNQGKTLHFRSEIMTTPLPSHMPFPGEAT